MAPPDFTLTQIIAQLQTQWSDDKEGVYRSWQGDHVIYSYPFSSPETTHGEDAGFVAPTATEQAFIREAFELWDDLIAIDLNDSANNPDAAITIAFSSTTRNGGTYTTPSVSGTADPNQDKITSERIWLNTGWPEHQSNAFGYGERGFENIIHEIGHALGLSHPGSYDASDPTSPSFATDAEYSQDTLEWTVMSYFGAGDDGTSVDHVGMGSYSDVNNDGVNISSPLLHDVLAIQAKYGADMSTRTGDDTYGFNAHFSNLVYRGALDFTQNVNPVICIWDAGGIDTLDVSGYTQNQRINLNAGAISDIGALTLNVAIAYGCTIENAVGGSGNDTITGNEVHNVLEGRDGNDTLNGGPGLDYLYGGNGDDVYELFDIGPGGGYDFVANIGGTDMVLLKHVAGGPTSYTLTFDIQNGGFVDPTYSGFTLNGSDRANELYDDIGSNTLNGMGGDDFIDAGAGNDTLEGGTGADILQGNTGDDIYNLFDVTNGAYDTVVENANAGNDIVLVKDLHGSVRSYTMTANVERGAIIGHDASGFTLHGNNLGNQLFDDLGDNILYGEGGDDILNGGGGQDILLGGPGNDTYQLQDRGSAGAYDIIAEEADSGNDYVEITPIHINDAPDSFILPSNFETARLLGSINFDLFGSIQSNVLYGNAGDNVIFGRDGDDTLLGGEGRDTLHGGRGDDSYYLDDLATFSGTPFATLDYDIVAEEPDQGIDTVTVNPLHNPDFISDFYALGDNVENLVVFGSLAFDLFGNDLANVMTGNSGNNNLYGGAGDDTLDGGLGTDELYGDDGDDIFISRAGSDAMHGGDGTDTVSYAHATSRVQVVTGNNVLNAGDASGDTFDLIERMIGSSYDDAINIGNGWFRYVDGGAGNDTIHGSGGDDLLIGGSGVDTLYGRGGNDIYVLDNAGDVVDELGATGIDTVRTWVSVDLGDAAHFKGDIEKVQLKGSADLNVTGNDLDNTITGNSGANVLLGEGGRDYIAAGAGNDTIYGGAKGDFLYGNKGVDLIAPGAGADHVDGGLDFDRVWYGDSSGGVSVDLATGLGARNDAAGDTYAGIERVTGSAFSDSIVGNALANALKGGAGDDIVYGKDGRDVIEGQAGKDQLYGGGGNDNLLGGDGNDRLFGNSGLDKLYGGAGNDHLTGGADADYFVFETDGAIGFGGDIVYDFQDGIDRLDMRGVYLTSDPVHTPIGFDDLAIGAWGDGVKIVVQNDQIVYLDHAATHVTMADIDAGDFLFA